MNDKNEFENLNLPKKSEVEPEQLIEQNKEEELVKVTVEPDKKPVIEIPQEYYDKIEEEKKIADEQQEAQNSLNEQVKQNFQDNQGLFGLAFINFVVYLILLITMIKVNSLIIYAIPAYMVISSIILAIKDKKKTLQPTASLIAGVLSGTISFVLSIMIPDKEDLFIYYTFALVICGILGLLTSSIISFMINEKDKVKALGTIGIIIYLVAVFGTPYVLDNKFHEKYYKYVFRTQAEVKATTEKEFIEKTLNSRYNVKFTCGEGKKTNNANQKASTSRRVCKSDTNEEIDVISIAYKESEVLYVVEDNYMDVKALNEFKTKLNDRLSAVTGATASIALYPEDGCLFVGDCHDCKELEETYSKQNDLTNMYEFSTSLNLEKYLNMNSNDFVNNYKFKYIIDIQGKYNALQSSNYEDLVKRVITELTDSGLKNTYGFEIIIKNTNAYNKPVYKVVGEKSDDGSFEKYQIEEL